MSKIIIQVSGPDKSGKGHTMAAIAHALGALGANVSVQAAETHNSAKLAKTADELRERLSGVEILLTEMRTS